MLKTFTRTLTLASKETTTRTNHLSDFDRVLFYNSIIPELNKFLAKPSSDLIKRLLEHSRTYEE